MLGDDGVTSLNDRLTAQITADPVKADIRNFYKVELWTRDDQIERMLFAGATRTRKSLTCSTCGLTTTVPIVPPSGAA